MGASKWGWSTWMVGASGSPLVRGIVPLVPIMPSLMKDLHRQWMSYGGWTFAFQDYLDVGLMDEIDDPKTAAGFAMMDPMTFKDNLAKIPKFVGNSQGDEFMQMDWTNIWADDFKDGFGETHLMIAPNSDHSPLWFFTGGGSSSATFLRSVAAG